MKPLIGILIVAVWISPVNAQETTNATNAKSDWSATPESHPYRSPRKALILGSLFPGAGHIYAGEYWRGVMNYEGTASALFLGSWMFLVDNCTFDFLNPNCDPGPEWPHQAFGVAVVGLGFWEWISSARDAPRAAERANERHRRKTAQARPIIGPAAGSHGGWHAGVEIPW